MQLENWKDLICNQCDSGAKHVRIDRDDAAHHDDAIILEALCDSCYEQHVVRQYWIHKGTK